MLQICWQDGRESEQVSIAEFCKNISDSSSYLKTGKPCPAECAVKSQKRGWIVKLVLTYIFFIELNRLCTT